MCARLYVLFILLLHMILAKCVTVNKINIEDIISKTKIELSRLYIPAGLEDIIIISAPIIDSNTLYHLSKPNGDVEELKLNISRLMNHKLSTDQYNAAKYFKEPKTISPLHKYRIFNLNFARNCRTHDDFKEKEKELSSNDFMIGPLGEDDHGNWILSAFYKENGEWVEMFQVISIEIKETIPTTPARPRLHPGEDLYLRFAYPLQHLESCQIIAPRSTFDRFYDRDMEYLDSCGFFVPNVTSADEGLWIIIGVGKIVYEANIFLQIKSEIIK